MTKKLKIQLLFALILLIPFNSNSQTYVNETWKNQEGNPDVNISWTESITSSFNEVIVVGNTSNPTENYNIYLIKYDEEGNKLWDVQYNGSTSGNDYGTGLEIDALGNIYVSGASMNLTSNNIDFVVLKYDDSGNLLWSYTYDALGGDDIPMDIKSCQNGNLIVTGLSMGTNTQNDFLTIMLDQHGQQLWLDRYDYNQLNDGAVGIEVMGPGEYIISGGSQSNTTNYAGVTIIYDDNGNQMQVERLEGTTFFKVTGVAIDANKSIYITGYADNSSGDFDYKTIKTDSNLNIIWTSTHDESGMNDMANAIELDNTGNIYVTGSVTSPNGYNETRTIKYNSNGIELWSNKSYLNNSSIQAKGVDITVNSNNEIGIVSEVTDYNNYNHQVLTTVYGQGGETKWQRLFSIIDKEVPTQISSSSNIFNVTGISGNSSLEYFIVSYNTYDKINTSSNTTPEYVKTQIIVDFYSKEINTTNINDDKIGFGYLKDFLSIDAINDINNRLSEFINPDQITVTRIFTGLKSYHKISTSRSGKKLRVPHYWSTLLLSLPTGTDETQISQFLSASPYVNSTELNYILETSSIPNDLEYAKQRSLHSWQYPNGHINIEGAWDIATGRDYVKVGVVDLGINYMHQDFQFNGQSRVVGGYHHAYNKTYDDPSYSWDETSHGTKVAGIIGAKSYNSVGIAGIAGGDSLNAGVSLYNLGCGSSIGITVSAASSAIIHGATNSNSLVSGTVGYGLGVHTMNHSYGQVTSQNPSILLQGAIRTAFRNEVINIAARGNKTNNPNSLPQYPACFEDHLIINVGGSNMDGEYWGSLIDSTFGAAIGHGVDITAPAQQTDTLTGNYLIWSTAASSNNNQTIAYLPFGATSAASPHVTGVAALLLSYVNQNGCASNLSTEDVEYLLEKSAKDITTSPANVNYDDYTGYGLLDATATIEALEMPKYRIKHFNGAVNEQTVLNSFYQESGWTPRYFKTLKGHFDSFGQGHYPSHWYKISMLIPITLETNEVVIDDWIRLSGTNLYGSIVGNGPHIYNERSVETYNFSASSSQAIIEGYAYQVVVGNDTLWFPEELNEGLPLTIGFSLYTKNDQATSYSYPCSPTVGIHTVDAPTIDATLYPNPASSNQTGLKFTLLNNNHVSITIFDITGRYIKTVMNQQQNKGVNFVSIPLEGMANGLYLINLKTEETNQTIKFLLTR